MKRYRVHVFYRAYFLAPETDYTTPESDLETARAVLGVLKDTKWQVHSSREWIEVWCKEHGWQPEMHGDCLECYAEQSRKEMKVFASDKILQSEVC